MEASWWRVRLAAENVLALQDEMSKRFLARGYPTDAALFSPTDFHPGMTVYFSPAAAQIGADLLQALGAEPCECPGRAGMNFLLGRADAPDQLLGE